MVVGLVAALAPGFARQVAAAPACTSELKRSTDSVWKISVDCTGQFVESFDTVVEMVQVKLDLQSGGGEIKSYGTLKYVDSRDYHNEAKCSSADPLEVTCSYRHTKGGRGNPTFRISGDVHFETNLDASGAVLVSSWTDSSTYGEMDRTTARYPFNAVRKVDTDAVTSAVSDLWN